MNMLEYTRSLEYVPSQSVFLENYENMVIACLVAFERNVFEFSDLFGIKLPVLTRVGGEYVIVGKQT